jgi:hypothetical protein
LRKKGRLQHKAEQVAPHGMVWKNVDSVAVLIMHDLVISARDLTLRRSQASVENMVTQHGTG